MTILRRNCRSKWGEIDLLARDGETVVFVEVKTRSTSRWGLPEDAVTPAKQFKIGMAARSLCNQFRLHGHPLRFDVVAVLLEENAEPAVKHFRDAFSVRMSPLRRGRT